MFIFLPSGWSRDWAEAQFGCSWSFSIIFLEPQFNWKDRNVKMKLKKKWGGFSFWEDGIDILFLSSSHQAKLITLTIIHKTSMSRLRREASPGASRPKEWHMVLPRLRERQTGNHRCHQETPAEALSLVKGPGQEQPQDRILSDRNLCSSHTTWSSYPPSQASGHPSVPWPPSCRDLWSCQILPTFAPRWKCLFLRESQPEGMGAQGEVGERDRGRPLLSHQAVVHSAPGALSS